MAHQTNDEHNGEIINSLARDLLYATQSIHASHSKVAYEIPRIKLIQDEMRFLPANQELGL